ncbi:hypothetical protein AMS68_000543 [Peltaster fructicola]|uniref:Calcineurin-like phosphoesterase domain-containing protein n=1 Tax=Peltaster fructicola TaxID=286661 RepID=A0A6H0XJY8_9PEZI|nr:hypothetical protein AMS68_000543 [Peltaster fructicola]
MAMKREGMILRLPFAPQTPWDSPLFIFSLINNPTKTLIRFLDLLFNKLRSQPTLRRHPIRVVCISDTHCLKWDDIPPGDLLIHSGDLTNNGTISELQAQVHWLNTLPHPHKVDTGNHDTYLDTRSRKTLPHADQQGRLNWGNIHYLQHSSVTLKFKGGRALNIYGAASIPAIDHPEWAFTYPPSEDAWTQTIPRDTDILITHGPPQHHLDLGLGCPFLLKEVNRVRPRLQVFGHVHAARSWWLGFLMSGRELARWDALQRTVERALTRSDGLVGGLLNPQGWIDVLRVLYLGTASLLWDRIWGGQGRTTLMVNAALMYNATGVLRNAPQVVDI